MKHIICYNVYIYNSCSIFGPSRSQKIENIINCCSHNQWNEPNQYEQSKVQEHKLQFADQGYK